MEHVNRPRDLMAHVRGWLRPGGARRRRRAQPRVAAPAPGRADGPPGAPRRPLARATAWWATCACTASTPSAPTSRARASGWRSASASPSRRVPNSMMLDWPPDADGRADRDQPRAAAAHARQHRHPGGRAGMSAAARVAANGAVLADLERRVARPRRRRRGRPGRRVGPDRRRLRLEQPPRRHGEPGHRRRPASRSACAPARAGRGRRAATGPSACCTSSPSAPPSAATRAWRGAGSSATPARVPALALTRHRGRGARPRWPRALAARGGDGPPRRGPRPARPRPRPRGAWSTAPTWWCCTSTRWRSPRRSRSPTATAGPRCCS